jgi:hypothetical protein
MESQGIIEMRIFHPRIEFEFVPKLNANCKSVGEVDDGGTFKYTEK